MAGGSYKSGYLAAILAWALAACGATGAEGTGGASPPLSLTDAADDADAALRAAAGASDAPGDTLQASEVGAAPAPDAPSPGPDAAPPASDVAPPALDTVEPAADSAPAALDTVEPAADSAPAALDTVEPAADSASAALDTVEPAADIAPAAPDTVEPAADSAPVAPDAVEPAGDSAPAAPDAVEPAADSAPAALDTVEPAADSAPPAPDTVQPAADSAPAAPDAVEPAEDVPPPAPDAEPDPDAAPDAAPDPGPAPDAVPDADPDADAAPDPGPDLGPPQPPVQAADCSKPCATFSPPAKAGQAPWPLKELSGLAASRIVPGVLWTHNDAGDTARFFALSDKAVVLGTYDVQDVTPTDWEDIATGPCPAGQCLFIGDIGDNQFARDEYQVWRVTEPTVDPKQTGVKAAVQAEKVAYVYPGGIHLNAETLLVHPQTGDIYVVTKWGLGKPGSVYRLPQPYVPGTVGTMVLVTVLDAATADSPMTGGSISPCGQRVLLRTYGKLYALTAKPGAGFESAFQQPAQVVPVADEVQGEAVAWRWDGTGYFTISEGGWPTLWGYGCLP